MPVTRSPGVPSLRRFTVCNIRPARVEPSGVLPITPILPSTTLTEASLAFLEASATQVDLGRRAVATHRNLACTSRDRCALASLKALLTWCSDRDACVPGLADKIHIGYQSQPGRALDFQQLLLLREELLRSEARAATMPANGGGARLLLTLLETGARIGEVRLALRGEVDLRGGVLRRPTSKTRRPRVIVLGPAVEVLERQLAFANEWLFPGVKSGAPLCYGAVVTLLQRSARRAGIPHPTTLTPHDLRHTFATLAYELGCSIEEIAAALAHSPATTRRYYLHNAISPGAIAVQKTFAAHRRAA